MRVVLLNTSEENGGAAIAAKRLMKVLLVSGIDASMIVRDRSTTDPHVISINNSLIRKKVNFIRFVWERFIIFISNKLNRDTLFRVSFANTGTDISKMLPVQQADIIHIHWINQGFLSLKDISKLIHLGKPVIWTMHDMWPSTGICHHSRECDNFTKGCGQCFFLQSKRDKDLSHKIFLRKKKKIFSNTNIIFVGCSRWLANKAKISELSKNHVIVSIPNPIDINTFKVLDKISSRKKSGLPENKKLILFGAANITDKRKGIFYLIDALNNIDLTDLCLVVFGQAKEAFRSLLKIPVYSIGYLNNQDEIVTLYNAVDLFVIPSLEENLPNTIMEAMACGIPCVGFNIGGIPEMIDHKQNGYVASYKDTEDFANGILWCLENYQLSTIEARKKVENYYSEEIVAKQYIHLYQQFL